MKTFTVQLADDVADKLSGLADVRGVTVENLVAVGAKALVDDIPDDDDFRRHFTPDQIASIEAGLADAAAGRTYSHEEVMSELRIKYGW